MVLSHSLRMLLYHGSSHSKQLYEPYIRKAKYSFIIIFLLILQSKILVAQFYDSKGEILPFYEYHNIGDIEFVNTWTIADYVEPSSMSKIFIDGKRRFHFAYYDSSIKKPVYISGKGSAFKKQIIDDRLLTGTGIAMTVVSSSFTHTAYINENDGSLQYANNLSGTFNTYPADIRSLSGFSNIEILISQFQYPVIFFTDKKENVYLSRFYQNVFFTEPIYTNAAIKKINAYVDDYKYSLFLQEKYSGNIIYGARENNTKFRFYPNRAVLTNVNSYSIKFDDAASFSITYNSKDNPNTIKHYQYNNRVIRDEVIINFEEDIARFTADYKMGDGLSILVQDDSGMLYLYTERGIIDLSMLQKTEGEIALSIIDNYLYSIIYQNAFTKELKLALISTSPTRKH